MGTFVYTNTFDPDGDGDNLNGATQTDTSGPNTGNVGVVNSASSGDPDNEFVIFDDGNKTRLELNADLTGDERVNQFAASMSVDFVTNPGPWGDGEPDGITFNLGDPSTMQSPEEKRGFRGSFDPACAFQLGGQWLSGECHRYSLERRVHWINYRCRHVDGWRC